jgi:hypothetical protein
MLQWYVVLALDQWPQNYSAQRNYIRESSQHPTPSQTWPLTRSPRCRQSRLVASPYSVSTWYQVIHQDV